MLRVLLLLVALGPSVARGDVVTSVSGSKLVVTGDDGADTVLIEPASDGIRVVGLDGTLVDGSGEGIVVPGIRRLTVKLRQGADRLTIRDVSLSGKIDLRLGEGNDRVELDGVDGGSTRIRTDDGWDGVSVDGPSRFDHLSIQTSNGDDWIWIDDAWITGDLTIDTGADEDDVTIVDTEVDDDVDVHLGNDEDDLFLADVSFDDDTHLDGENGEDDLFLDGWIWFGDDLDVDGFDDDWWW
jgi:large repetitive protein